MVSCFCVKAKKRLFQIPHYCSTVFCCCDFYFRAFWDFIFIFK